MRQVTTPTSWPSARRNAAVVAANIECQAVECERKATRWSNLCGLCERQFLENMKPCFGKPTSDQLKTAQKVIRDHYGDLINNGVFDDWSSQISRAFTRPLSKLVSPFAASAPTFESMHENRTIAVLCRMIITGVTIVGQHLREQAAGLWSTSVVPPQAPERDGDGYRCIELGV